MTNFPLSPAREAWYRQQAEHFGLMADDAACDGVEYSAYEAARQAAHYGNLSLGPEPDLEVAPGLYRSESSASIFRDGRNIG